MRERNGQVRAITFEQYQEKQRNGGRPPEHRPSLWESFNEVVTDMSIGLRKKARQVISSRLESPAYTDEDKQLLHRRFNDVVGGGLKGAVRAAQILWLDPEQSSPRL